MKKKGYTFQCLFQTSQRKWDKHIDWLTWSSFWSSEAEQEGKKKNIRLLIFFFFISLIGLVEACGGLLPTGCWKEVGWEPKERRLLFAERRWIMASCLYCSFDHLQEICFLTFMYWYLGWKQTDGAEASTSVLKREVTMSIHEDLRSPLLFNPKVCLSILHQSACLTVFDLLRIPVLPADVKEREKEIMQSAHPLVASELYPDKNIPSKWGQRS